MENEKKEAAYVYMVRCEDDSVYTGITKDVQRRMQEHKTRGKECAKYTRSHRFQKLEAVFEAATWAEAARLEYAIKRLKKSQKEKLIAKPKLVETMFSEVLSGCRYFSVEVK